MPPVRSYRAQFTPLKHHGPLVFVGELQPIITGIDRLPLLGGAKIGVITTEKLYKQGEPPLAIVTEQGDVRHNIGLDLPLLGRSDEIDIGKDITFDLVPTPKAIRRVVTGDVH